MEMETDVGQTPEIHFRPVKRQKFLRKRAESETADLEVDNTSRSPQDPDQQRAVRTTNVTSTSQEDDGNSEDEASNIVRLRKPHRVRRGGIEFSAGNKQRTNGDLTTQTETSAEDVEGEIIRAKFDRFTAHTGQKVDVDKHMMEYIESELAKRYHRNQTIEEPSPGTHVADDTTNGQSDSRFPQREPAALGKLHEIDLGQEAKLQNIARTEAATRRLAGNKSPSPEEETSRKTRLGKDGKPWRGRKRRTSEDIERDRLVEEVLRESKLEVYDEPEQDRTQDDQAADDRIAEQFRRDFLEAIQSRRRAARPRKATKSDAPRGPKLGGSRSARAAMREMQAKSGQK
ncbi:hypothetical protein VTN77DRAFT_9925 [Rasamsonia byssochlamydoides]|uniref:uncharacterized protein n=1 Tax=Rasamsonia byssochlamydoides TaxID=89139 RepID=UPI0037425244